MLLTACEREDRPIGAMAWSDPHSGEITMSSNHPGPGAPQKRTDTNSDYEKSAYQVAEGKRLYTWFNCNGCHFNGGGGIGPALMDDKWIYGSSIENIAATIREGRPNGMPSFRGLIPDNEIWQIAAYVRSLGGFVPKDVDPSRNDDINARPAENRLPTQKPASAPTSPLSGQGKL
jgi:cytochrome c oxidase cbb3-type subunit 3